MYYVRGNGANATVTGYVDHVRGMDASPRLKPLHLAYG